jgi:hypothetical protein
VHGMSSFKADSYFKPYAGDEFDPDYRESSEEDSTESDTLPFNVKRERAQWIVDNQEALEELFQCFKRDGQAIFGRAFYQLGDINQFVKFVFKTIVPGGN